MQTIRRPSVLSYEAGDPLTADQWRNLALCATFAAFFLLLVAAAQFYRAERAERDPPPRRIIFSFESRAGASARAPAVLPAAGAIPAAAEVAP